MNNHPSNYNYDDLIKRISEDPEKKESVEEYEKKFHIKRNSNIKDHPFYQYHLSKFNPDFDLVTPPDVNMSPQEWDLLTRLIFGSLSSNFLLTLDEAWKDNPVGKVRAEICVAVSSEKDGLSKLLSELCDFQIDRLFEIYVNEQIDLFLLWKEDSDNHQHDDKDSEEEYGNLDSWQMKQEQKARYNKFERQTKYLMTDVKFYKNIHKFMLSLPGDYWREADVLR